MPRPRSILYLPLILTGLATTAAADPAPVFSISGSVDAYLSVSPTTGGGPNALHAFDVYSNDLSFSYAEITLERAASPVGLRIDLGFGPTADAVNATDAAAAGGYDLMRNVQQAFVTWRAGGELTLRFGKFVTPFGQEVIETQGNWNYTRGLLFTWAIPFTHTGLAAQWVVSPKLEITGFVTNGLNNTLDANEFKSPAVQVILRPGAWVLVANYGLFNELPDAAGEIGDFGDAVHLFDAIAAITVAGRYDLAVNADVGYDPTAGSDGTFFGVAAYARARFTDRLDASVRGEYFADSDSPTLGVLGANGDLVEATGTLSYAPAQGLLLRAEGRWDHALGDFTPFAGGAEADQITFTAGAVAGF